MTLSGARATRKRALDEELDNEEQEDLFGGLPAQAGVQQSGGCEGIKEGLVLAFLLVFGLALLGHRSRSTIINHWRRYGEEPCPVGGLYIDPHHYDGGRELRGMRMVSDRIGMAEATKHLTMLGTDNGSVFWTLHGAMDGGDSEGCPLYADFTPKGGPLLGGNFYHEQNVIKWQTGGDELPSEWRREELPGFNFVPAPPSKQNSKGHVSTLLAVGGLFTTPAHEPGTLKGTRMISNQNGTGQPGGELTMVGTDDGYSFWTLVGKVAVPEPGDRPDGLRISFDVAPLRTYVQAEDWRHGTLARDRTHIRWDDWVSAGSEAGNMWVRQTVIGDKVQE